MISAREVTYTTAGKKKLEAAKEKFANMLEKEVVGRKYVPGDVLVEITASDVERAWRLVRFESPFASGRLRFALTFYIIMGLLVSLSALLYSTMTVEMPDWGPPVAISGICFALLFVMVSSFLPAFLKSKAGSLTRVMLRNFSTEAPYPPEQSTDLARLKLIVAEIEEMRQRVAMLDSDMAKRSEEQE